MAFFIALARKRDAENSEAFPEASMNRFIESAVLAELADGPSGLFFVRIVALRTFVPLVK